MKTAFHSIERMGVAMDFHRARHSVLAGNVANVDTPGYRPADLERVGSATAAALDVVATRPGHLGRVSIAGDTVFAFDDGSAMVGADGNAVNLERELAKVDANRLRYNTNSELVSRRLALLAYAATDGSG